ncbi:MAG: hypothetical protein ACE5R6_17955 [Candidatus Heimdallarchaeota archaeon]
MRIHGCDAMVVVCVSFLFCLRIPKAAMATRPRPVVSSSAESSSWSAMAFLRPKSEGVLSPS